MSADRLPEEQNLPEFISRSLLSKPDILKHYKLGNIIIDPFNIERVHTASVDVTLGPNHYRPHPESVRFYNPWDEETVRKYWGEPQYAPLASELLEFFGNELPENIRSDDRIILFRPHEMILCHTNEFIGGRVKVTTMMKARSSVGRSEFVICSCAGWGDVGYTNRWTMEIRNNCDIWNLLIVGEHVGQIAFFEVTPLEESYVLDTGKYQTSDDIREIKNTWTPEAMLPKMWKDRQ